MPRRGKIDRLARSLRQPTVAGNPNLLNTHQFPFIIFPYPDSSSNKGHHLFRAPICSTSGALPHLKNELLPFVSDMKQSLAVAETFQTTGHRQHSESAAVLKALLALTNNHIEYFIQSHLPGLC